MNKAKQEDLIGKLDAIPLGRIYQASFKALMRLQVYFTGRTHELMLEFRDKAQGAVLRKGGRDNVLDASSAFGVQSAWMQLWGDTWTNWSSEFQQIRRESARIAFGVQAVSHDRLVASQIVTEGRSIAATLQESNVTDGVYDPQLRILIGVADEYLHGDSMNLSGRIWRIDREARDGINAVLLNGIQKGDSAWNIAKQLEEFLGAGNDCPRWTSTRLYGRTKKDIASGDTTGLLSGNACDGSGVSYNALRLARTEIQKIHGLATDRMMKQQPWVREEQIHLSAAHPETDICDKTIAEGRDEQGIYEVGEIILPLHPNCLCYKTAVLMPQDEFTSKMNDWLKGGQWREMDQYANELGIPPNEFGTTDLMPAALNLAVWLFSDELQEFLK
jgi:hypothetical protein